MTALAIHPRVSVSEMCTYPWPLGDELALWDQMGIRQVGLLAAKVDAFGRQAAIDELRRRSMVATTVITSGFDLSAPTGWAATRESVNRAIELAGQIGGCVYLTPGRRDGRSFDELTDALAEAVAPCVAYAAAHGVRLALEPSLRTDVSYVHCLRDAIDVADRTGLALVADIGNCWMERDPEDMIRRAGSRIAVVQVSDASFGTAEHPPPSGRLVPGDGDLALAGFLRAALETGYSGAVELEMVGPRIEAEGHGPATRRGVERLSALLHELA